MSLENASAMQVTPGAVLLTLAQGTRRPASRDGGRLRDRRDQPGVPRVLHQFSVYLACATAAASMELDDLLQGAAVSAMTLFG